MAYVEDPFPQAPAKTGPSLIIQIAVLLVMSLAAAGIGWFSGSSLGGSVVPPAGDAAAAPAEGGHGAPAGGHGEASGGHGEAAGGHGEAGGEESEGEHGAGGDPLLLNLPSITTNLAAPSDTWARVELSVQLEKPSDDPKLAETIHQDFLAFIRTLKLHQIEGASGFQHLKADLTERAAIRSNGLVKGVFIRTLLFE
jgi:flagellar FliL protein